MSSISGGVSYAFKAVVGLVKIFSAICKKPTIVYLVYYLLRITMNMKYGSAVIILFYFCVTLIF